MYVLYHWDTSLQILFKSQLIRVLEVSSPVLFSMSQLSLSRNSCSGSTGMPPFLTQSSPSLQLPFNFIFINKSLKHILYLHCFHSFNLHASDASVNAYYFHLCVSMLLVTPSFPSQRLKRSQCRNALLLNFSTLQIHNTGEVRMAA